MVFDLLKDGAEPLLLYLSPGISDNVAKKSAQQSLFMMAISVRLVGGKFDKFDFIRKDDKVYRVREMCCIAAYGQFCNSCWEKADQFTEACKMSLIIMPQGCGIPLPPTHISSSHYANNFQRVKWCFQSVMNEELLFYSLR